MVFYRKYRPQTIADLDSKKLRDTLYAVLKPESVPHAFLFTGPKGLGKTSTARIVAKVVNCENLKNGEPCNTCDQCVSITNGTNIDVLEIDGASNRGIDEIRELRDRVKLAPSGAKKKVYIIDEVHMLTTEAFNALLKTIEEPPSHVMFIFCTTEAHKVPATILSRCFHIGFTLATKEELMHSLQRIVKAEKIEIENDALSLIADLSDGGFRDGAKYLEEMLALSEGKKITKAFVEEKYKVSGISHFVSNLLALLSEKKVKDALEQIKQIVAQGIDLQFIMGECLKTLHEILLEKLEVSTDATYKKLNTKYSLEDIQLLVSLLSDAYLQTKTAVIKQLPLEMAVIAYCNNTLVIPTSASPRGEKAGIPSVNAITQHTMSTLLKKQQATKVANIIRPVPKEKVVTPTGPSVAQGDINSQKDGNAALMENLIYKVKPFNHSVAGVLRGCSVSNISDSEIIFETAYKFHKDRLEEKKSYEIIEKAIREITGKQLKVIVQLKNRK